MCTNFIIIILSHTFVLFVVLKILSCFENCQYCIWKKKRECQIMIRVQIHFHDEKNKTNLKSNNQQISFTQINKINNDQSVHYIGWILESVNLLSHTHISRNKSLTIYYFILKQRCYGSFRYKICLNIKNTKLLLMI